MTLLDWIAIGHILDTKWFVMDVIEKHEKKPTEYSKGFSWMLVQVPTVESRAVTHLN